MQFDFGQNWKEFSENSLTAEKVEQAREHFRILMKNCPLKDRRFIDIGFGQGLSLLLALQEGARVTGIDINPKCVDVLERNKQLLDIDAPVEILVGSILEDSTLGRLDHR